MALQTEWAFEAAGVIQKTIAVAAFSAIGTRASGPRRGLRYTLSVVTLLVLPAWAIGSTELIVIYAFVATAGCALETEWALGATGVRRKTLAVAAFSAIVTRGAFDPRRVLRYTLSVVTLLVLPAGTTGRGGLQ